MLDCILCRYDRDGDTLNGKTLVLVAGGLAHVTFDNKACCCLMGCKRNFCIDVNAFTVCEADDLQELCVTDDAAYPDLVLECEVAVVDDAQLGEPVGTAGFPENSFILAAFGLDPAQRLTLGVYPLIVDFHFECDVKRTCLNRVDCCGSSIGEPSECCAD